MIGIVMRPFSAFASRSLFVFDPEKAHGLSVAALKSGVVPACSLKADPRLAQTIAGIRFENPIGLAAGYDKNAEVPDAVLKLGFGFTEVGTVTPKPQAGNDKPRIFRLVEDRGIINRLGFNNEGHEAAFQRLSARRGASGIVGVNIGANKDAQDRIADYVAGIRKFYGLATYFTANISSPNTPGLRDLQARDSLKTLLDAILSVRDEEAARHGRSVPIFLKIAPDLTEEGMDDVAAEATSHALDGLIVSNTTLARDGLRNQAQAKEMGGLSGAPLFSRSTTVLAKMRQRVGKDLPIIGVGGVGNAAQALEKIRAGADLVQVYSCMVYEGPGLPSAIVRGLSSLLDQEKVTSIRALRDTHLDRWAAKSL